MKASAQINLLQRPPITTPRILWGLVILVSLMIGYLGYTVYLVSQRGALESRIQALQQEKNKVGMALAQTSTGGLSRLEIEKDIKDLRSKHGNFLEKLEGSPPGRAENFSRELSLLSQANTKDVWLSEISVEGASGKVTLSGKALSSQAVFSYSNRLNRIFEAHGASFDSVEITGESAPANVKGPSDQLKTKTVSFRLQ
jgi:hypothetical protein